MQNASYYSNVSLLFAIFYVVHIWAKNKASYEDITMLDLIYDADATRTAYGPFQTL